MHQRDRARKVFEDAGTLRTKDGKLQRLIKEVESRPAMCWPELADEVRARYPEYKEQLAQILWNSGDKLIRINMIRHSDPRVSDELEGLARLVEAMDPIADAAELQAVVDLGDRRLVELVAKKPGIPPTLAQVVETRLHPSAAGTAGKPDKPAKTEKAPKNRAGR